MFENCRTLDELKKAYRKAAMENHPDRGGSTEKMQEINSAYEHRFNLLKSKETVDADGEAVDAGGESPSDFINIISTLLKLDGIDIELCGRWLWIGGNTRPLKDSLSAAGCRWCSKKKLWSWHFPEDSKRGSRSASMNYIRKKYGSRRFSGPAHASCALGPA